MSQPAVAGNAPPGQPQQQQGGIMAIVQSILRMVMIYWAITYFMGTGKKPNSPPVIDEETGDYKPVAKVTHLSPLWNQKLLTDLYVYISEEDYFNEFTDVSKLVWKETNLVFGDLADTRTKTITVDMSPEVQNNGTLYAHIYLTERGRSPNPKAKSFEDRLTLYHRKALTRFHKKKKVVIKKKLVGDSSKKEEEVPKEEEDEEEDVKDLPIVSYWWSNMTVTIVPEFNQIPAALPPPVASKLKIHKDGVHFLPVFEVDDFWLMSEHLHPINETVKVQNLTMFYQPKSWWYFTLLSQFEENFRMQNAMMGVDQKETDEIKRMFLETNPILLVITVCVSLLHSIFDFLAFKNDIAFWQNKKDMDGMSFRAIILNVGFQLIIFLYLLDNDTSWMILISNGVGLLIEAWKIQKTVIVKTKAEFPFVEFIDKHKPSKTARKTMKYDKIAFKYLSYVLYPLLFGYAVYSVYYEEHKSCMTPQLFINYKLKSVAHMPWKTFMYKALNTFIDDVIFLIYLYQRWIYPEDKRRRNEFGQIGEDVGPEEDDDDDDSDDEDAAKKSAKKDEATAVKDVKEGSTDEGLRKRKTGDVPTEPTTTSSPPKGKKESSKSK
ncbi:hypothetical protein HDU97_009369 [Phlyctochytrium planicorne]|nr:hypothetical protein HDU97_009369 [Phlyctochytrium planicorne]